MRTVPIAQVLLSADERLLVVPLIPAHDDFEHIYRAALSARWLPDERALATTRESKLTHAEQLRCILQSASREYGVRLVPTRDTSWSISAILRSELEAIVASTAT